MSKVGNQTNSQDPQAVNSRVFVGNLNTFQCSKTDVERMFQRYGRLAGISMHKGYAFVQFTNPFDARSACLGEDGRTVLSQILDHKRHGSCLALSRDHSPSVQKPPIEIIQEVVGLQQQYEGGHYHEREELQNYAIQDSREQSGLRSGG
ncbi:hypothetical protein Trydic_g917 [Trypoxylus dichotomus]